MDILKLLKDYQSAGLNAFVAGGYVRDAILNKPQKDIDMFVIGDFDENKIDTAHSIKPNRWGLLTKPYYKIKNYSNMNIREDVLEIYKFDDLNIDVMVMNCSTIEQVLGNFDLSICQCACVLEGDELVYKVSEDFLDYIKSGTIYRYIDIDTHDNHLDRMKDKFGVDSFTEVNSKPIKLMSFKITE